MTFENYNLYGTYSDKISSDNYLSTSTTFDSLLPIARQISSSTFGADPMKIKEIENRIKSENRDLKIDSIVEGNIYVEKKIEDDIDYKKIMSESIISIVPMSSPTNLGLFYIDYIYGSSSI